MEKEYHITYSIDASTDGAKATASRIPRLMKEINAELISRNDDYDGYIDEMFHYHGNYTTITQKTNEILSSFKNSQVYLNVNVYEHIPKVSVDVANVINRPEFEQFLNEMTSKYGAISSEANTHENTITVVFQKSADRQAFQNDYTGKADKYMTNGNDGVNVFPDWEDITVLQKNNSSEQKRTTKYGY